MLYSLGGRGGELGIRLTSCSYLVSLIVIWMTWNKVCPCLIRALSLIKNAHCKCVHSCINAGNESQGADKDHSIVNRTTCNEYIDPFQKSVKFELILGKLL